MTALTIDAEAPPTASSFGAGRALYLQLLPGIASLPVFALCAFWFAHIGLPNVFALTLAIVLVEVPVSWAIIAREVRRTHGQFSWTVAFPWRASIPWWQYLLIGVPVVILSVALNVGLGPVLGETLRNALFSTVPDWLVMRPDPAMFANLSRSVAIALWLFMLFGMVIAGGVTQELFSRGFLLPRIQHLGFLAPLWNAVGFAMLHMAAPWSWPVFLLLSLPWALLVWWKRSVRIGLFAHIGMLLLQWIAMSLMLFGILTPPA